MVRKIDELDSEYIPISHQTLRLISSFRDLNQYPIFANFRQIMFVLMVFFFFLIKNYYKIE